MAFKVYLQFIHFHFLFKTILFQIFISGITAVAIKISSCLNKWMIKSNMCTSQYHQTVINGWSAWSLLFPWGDIPELQPNYVMFPKFFYVLVSVSFRVISPLSSYELNDAKNQIICFADAITLTAQNEDNLHRMRFRLNNNSKQYHMRITVEKPFGLWAQHSMFIFCWIMKF